MGFSAQQANLALHQFGGNLNYAAEFLVSGGVP